ncbi:MAG: efflux RND transporter periplasmic adaptor subunit [Anaerolineaceae bacterium]|nr:efflux RND transporter periplasmic adaptor subunit [Anaerolineaceae bacterium]
MTNEINPVKNKKKSRWWVTVLILVAIAAAIFLFINYRQQQALQATIADLRTVPLTRETLLSTISGTGNVQPRQSVVLVWQSGGTVAHSDVAPGDPVQAGQVLLSLDQEDLPADILQASLNKINAEQALENLQDNTKLQRANLENNIQTARSARTELETQLLNLESRECESWRLDNLRSDYDVALEDYQNWPTESGWFRVLAAKTAMDYCDPDVISQQIDGLQSQIDLQNRNEDLWQADLAALKNGPDAVEVEKLELQLRLAEKQLENQYIRAPFAGTVLSLNQDPGDQVTPGTVAAQVADMGELYVEVPISEVDIPAIEIDQPAVLTFDAYYEEEFNGTVTAISQSGDRATGVVNYIVTVRMDGDSDRIKPGMTASVSILTDEKPDALVVYSQSVFSRNGIDYVYVLRDGNLEMVRVTVGAYSNRMVEILETDIAEGELIVENPPLDILSSFGMGQGNPFRD